MGGNITKVESENQISSKVVYTSGDSKSYLNYKERQAISDSWNYISKNKLKYGTILFLR